MIHHSRGNKLSLSRKHIRVSLATPKLCTDLYSYKTTVEGKVHMRNYHVLIYP